MVSLFQKKKSIEIRTFAQHFLSYSLRSNHFKQLDPYMQTIYLLISFDLKMYCHLKCSSISHFSFQRSVKSNNAIRLLAQTIFQIQIYRASGLI